LVLPGVLVFSGASARGAQAESEVLDMELERFSERLREAGNAEEQYSGLPLWVMVDDAGFVSQSLSNFLWVTFTRSDPARDVHGIFAFTERKHWGCRGPLVIDARLKPHHAPPLESDPGVAKRVETMAAPGGPLLGLF
jgi:4-hydroxy-3-polyprenylbenzoate decarboxylase